jgi:hypothetical protein
VGFGCCNWTIIDYSPDSPMRFKRMGLFTFFTCSEWDEIGHEVNKSNFK